MPQPIPIQEALTLAKKRGIPITVPIYRAEKLGGKLLLYLYGRAEPVVVPARAAKAKGGAVKA